MVAISLYRGNQHKVPNVPRKWLTPTPTISPKDFKILLHRRSKALARLQSTDSNPNPNQQQEHDVKQAQTHNHTPQGEDSNHLLHLDPPPKVIDRKESDGGYFPVIPKLEVSVDVKPVITGITLDPNFEMNAKEERKRDIEEKLKILNARKHDLVQSLKQILNAEEELMRRSCMQGMPTRPSVSLQVDVTNDSGSMDRHLTHKMGSDGILRDGERGEENDASNHNIHFHNMPRMSSVTPSSNSPHRGPFHVVPHASRATLGASASASPSRFASTGQQGNLESLPTVSVSGTSYIASSPSPATSGGT